jgi:serine/threonine-protein phosphatase 6 catalytic subunit
MWSDPDDIETWSISPRGAGWLFGGRVTQEVCLRSLRRASKCHSLIPTSLFQFNHVNGLSLIARAHQLVQEGYKHMFDEQLVTVWSAPNYCYRCGNAASIMQVEDGGKTSFKVYNAAEENERDIKNDAARRVSVSSGFAKAVLTLLLGTSRECRLTSYSKIITLVAFAFRASRAGRTCLDGM